MARSDAARGADDDTGTAPQVLPGRRGVLVGAAALVGGTAVVGTAPSAAAASAEASPAGLAVAGGGVGHAAVQRGLDVAVAVGRAQEGRFGLMFKKLAAHEPPDALLEALADSLLDAGAPGLDTLDVSAGYTFLGQFVDHDLILDRTPLALATADPRGTVDFDTPLLDLGSVYGRGPDADPDLYEPDGSGRMRVVRNAAGVLDLPRRADGTALLGDARNDENLIVSQLHLAFLQFHNRLLDTGVATDLASAQKLARYHHQWLVVHEFLPRVVGQDVVDRFVVRRGATWQVKREHYKPKNPNQPMMPIEYSAVAYRFGHSMLRPGYLLSNRAGVRLAAATFGTDPARDLRGSRPLPADKEVDWELFFEVPGRAKTPHDQARLIDTRIAAPLMALPPTVVLDATTSLARRNLLRGKRVGLPSGQAVAAVMGLAPLSNTDLGLPDPTAAGWGGGAPLWFYVLKEAELLGGRRLGPVGGRIVAEVLLGVLDADRDSYLRRDPGFSPAAPIASQPGRFLVGDLVNFARGA